MWAEVNLVVKENKRELCLSGSDVAKRIKENGLDANIFELVNLNLLRISEVKLRTIPVEISHLTNLQTLILYGNDIDLIPCGFEKLEKLKFLDLSRNKIGVIPDFINALAHLDTINLSCNKIKIIPSMNKLEKLINLDLSFNCVEEFVGLCQDNLLNLSSLNLKSNRVNNIPGNLQNLSNLKQINLASNKIKCVPKNVVNLQKLKDIDLSENPLDDKRLLKLVKQCRSKQVLDYIKIHGIVVPTTESQLPMEGLNLGLPETNTKSIDVTDNRNKIFVKKYNSESIQVTAQQIVSDIRPHILCCIITNVRFTSELFKKFLQIQCKLHDTVCGRREKSTIATHDLQKIKGPTLVYTAKDPRTVNIRPLGKSKNTTALELYNMLKAEADNFRKEKKRNTYSAIHKYIHLLKDQTLFPCMEDAEHNIISLHPLTNSDMSKITEETTQIFLEVTSSTSMTFCRTTMEKLILELLLLGIGNKDIQDSNSSLRNEMEVQQVKIVNDNGDLKTVYPSKIDLNYESTDNVHVSRE